MSPVISERFGIKPLNVFKERIADVALCGAMEMIDAGLSRSMSKKGAVGLGSISKPSYQLLARSSFA